MSFGLEELLLPSVDGSASSLRGGPPFSTAALRI